MKRLFLMASILMLAPLFSAATVHTVSNNPDRPAQYTTIQAGVDAANPGDTLLITGGANYNESVTIIKNLVLYGEAIEGPDFPTTYISNITIGNFNSSLGASGTRFYGLRIGTMYINPNFTGAAVGQRVIGDLIFERCYFQSQIYMYPTDGMDDVTYRNCYFINATVYLNWAGLNPATLTNCILTNCVFDNSLIDSNSGGTDFDFNGNVIMRNNLFLNRTSSTFADLREVVLENNIFYKCEPTGLTLSTFNNNLTYLCNSNTIPYGDNLGSANIEGQNPNFVNYPALGGSHSWDWDYSLQPGSPAEGTGTNGTDIGLGGGNAPVANLPKYAKIPGVTLLDIPVSSVPVGGTLQINIEAESRD